MVKLIELKQKTMYQVHNISFVVQILTFLKGNIAKI